MKKVYCKYCGLELENGTCKCAEFLSSINKRNFKKENSVCDTCKKKIENDSRFCPYCGIPQLANNNLKDLQKELRGENAPDVLEVYRKQDAKNGIKNNKLKISNFRYIYIVIVSFIILFYSFWTFLLPYIKQKIADVKLKKELLSSPTIENIYDNPSAENNYSSTSYIEESSQQQIALRDKWIKQDGYFYAFDKYGDPVVDDWVTETDENGKEQKYYFDIDGKLVIDSWIDGEYYVGSDGAMLKNSSTPDGATVDEDGRVLLKDSEGVPVENETHVYYESPNSEAETVVASKQKSSNSGTIRGVDSTKTYELYVKDIIQKRETVTKGDLRCNIVYYLPVIEGAKEKEVKNINEALNKAFEEFKDTLIKEAQYSSQLPKSMTFNTVEQRTLNSNRMNIIVHGKVYPRHGLVEKRKFRFIYDRKSKIVKIADISE